MKLTKAWLKKHAACTGGYKYYIEKGETDLAKFLKLCIVENHFDWANWVITKKFTKKQSIKYACYAAKKVLKNFEKKYSDDKRPTEAISAALKCIEHNTIANRSAAWSAARAAWRAAVSAWSAAESAAESAAVSAAESAAWSAAWSAAVSAERAAESAALKKNIINYGIKLMEAL